MSSPQEIETYEIATRRAVERFRSGFYGANMKVRVAEELLEAYSDEAKWIIADLLGVVARDARTMLSLSCPFHKTKPENYF